MTQDELLEVVARLGEACRAAGLRVGTAESCTGGLVASTLTDVSGSSDWFVGAVVSYANEVKEGLLGVPGGTLAHEGAVSEPVVRAMAQGAARRLGADATVGISGVAGPTGGTPDKPVGTVWMAWCVRGQTSSEKFFFEGDRAAIKRQTVQSAILGLFARTGGA